MPLTKSQENLVRLMDYAEVEGYDLTEILDVNQSTISRLRGGKILKINKYYRILRDLTPDRDGLISSLTEKSDSSPELELILVSLDKLMHKNA